jgi:hypothetical protein
MKWMSEDSRPFLQICESLHAHTKPALLAMLMYLAGPSWQFRMSLLLA